MISGSRPFLVIPRVWLAWPDPLTQSHSRLAAIFSGPIEPRHGEIGLPSV
jgi:hypothetical protein